MKKVTKFHEMVSKVRYRGSPVSRSQSRTHHRDCSSTKNDLYFACQTMNNDLYFDKDDL